MLVDLITQQSSRLVVPVYQRPYSWSEENPGNRVGRDFAAGLPNFLWLTDVTRFSIPAGKPCLGPVPDCFDGSVVSRVNVDLPERGDGQRHAQGGARHRHRGGARPPRDPRRLRVPLPPARAGRHMRGGRRGRAGVAQGVLAGRLEDGGFLRDDEDGDVLRQGLVGRHPGGARVQDRRLHRASQHREDKALARRDEPASVQEEPGPRGVGSGYGKTVPPPFAQFELTRHR